MSYLDLTIPHSLTQTEALTRVKRSLAGLKRQHRESLADVEEEWDGPNGKISFSTRGLSVAGKIQVRDGVIRLSSRLPMILSTYKKKISAVIEKRGEELLVA